MGQILAIQTVPFEMSPPVLSSGLQKPRTNKDSVRKIVETQFGMNLEALEELLRDRLAAAVYPKDGNPAGNVLLCQDGS